MFSVLTADVKAIVRRSVRTVWELTDRTLRTMAMDQSALLETLEVLKAADVGDRIRLATEKL